MRVALFVEGGSAPAPPRRDVPLVAIWRHLAGAIGFDALAPIVPISKKDIVVMDRSPSKPRSSGSAEGLDQLMVRWLKRSPFDAAIVAWDSTPALDPEREVCRWEETLALYHGLAESSVLPEPWREAARHRFEALSTRDRPSQRRRPHRIGPHQVIAVCMEPMFEALLFRKEQHVFRAVGVKRRPADWPSQWGNPTSRPDDHLLIPLARSLCSGPRSQWPPIAKAIGNDARYDKDPWIEYLLRRLLDDPEARALVLAHPICRRLSECLGPP